MHNLTRNCFIVLLITIATIKDSCQYCQRFDTLEVLQRFYNKRTALPLTIEEAKEHGWNFVLKYNKYNIDIYRYGNINSLFIFFYKNELVGVGPTHGVHEPQIRPSMGDYKIDVRKRGLGIALPERVMSRLKGVWHDASHYGKREKIFRNVMYINNVKIHYGMIFFVDPGILKKGLDPPCSKNTIYIRGIKVPYMERDVQHMMPRLIKQGCQDRRGFYYFYDLKEGTRCSGVNGFFAFYNSGGILSGFGVMIFGDSNIEDHTHPLPIYSTLPIPYIREMVPHSTCARNKGIYGVSLLNIVIKPDTHSFKCPKNTNPAH